MAMRIMRVILSVMSLTPPWVGHAHAAQSVSLTLQNHHFVPNEIIVPSRERFRIDITNLDPSAAELESFDMHFEKIVVGGGGHAHVFAGPLHAGVIYNFFDDYNPDIARGTIEARGKE
jgi:hypothetical protein